MNRCQFTSWEGELVAGGQPEPLRFFHMLTALPA
jgi:hypothetical protein